MGQLGIALGPNADGAASNLSTTSGTLQHQEIQNGNKLFTSGRTVDASNDVVTPVLDCASLNTTRNCVAPIFDQIAVQPTDHVVAAVLDHIALNTRYDIVTAVFDQITIYATDNVVAIVFDDVPLNSETGVVTAVLHSD